MFAVFIQFGGLMHHPGDDFRFGEHGTDFPEQQIFQLCRRDLLQGADGVDAFHILFTGKVTIAFVLEYGEYIYSAGTLSCRELPAEYYSDATDSDFDQEHLQQAFERYGTTRLIPFS